MQIPKTIHQIWIGSNPPPYQWLNTLRIDFIKKYPDWKYILWNEEKIKDLTLINQDLWDKETSLHGKVDIIRLEILYQFGGIYIDADSVWLGHKSFDNLLSEDIKSGFFCAYESEETGDFVCNGVMGASKKNKVILHLIKSLKATYDKKKDEEKAIWEISGPGLLNEFCDKSKITIFPSKYFYPIHWYEYTFDMKIKKIVRQFPDSYLFHLGYTTHNYARLKSYNIFIRGLMYLQRRIRKNRYLKKPYEYIRQKLGKTF